MAQAKGSATRVVVDFESAFNTPKTTGKTGRIIPFISTNLGLSQPLQQSQTITGDRNMSKPYLNNREGAGDLVIPVLANSIGVFLKAGIGAPVTTEIPQNNVAPLTATTVSVADGTATFSQGIGGDGGAVAGDRVLVDDGGTIRAFWLVDEALAEDPQWLVASDGPAGTTNPPDLTGAAVLFISRNKAGDTPGTFIVDDGVLFLSEEIEGLAARDVVLYPAEGGSVGRLWLVRETTVDEDEGWVVVDDFGRTPADLGSGETPIALFGIETRPAFRHVFTPHPTAALPSIVVEKAFQDISPAYYEAHRGCKVNSIRINPSATGDGELTATISLMTASMAAEQYDATPTSLGGEKMFNSMTRVKEGGVTSQIVRSMDLLIENNLDGEQFVLNGTQTRRDLPEGLMGASGSIEALFENTAFLVKADGSTEVDMALEIEHSATRKITFSLSEAVFEHKSGPEISGPAGIVLPLNFSAYKDDGPGVVVAELINSVPAY